MYSQYNLKSGVMPVIKIIVLVCILKQSQVYAQVSKNEQGCFVTDQNSKPYFLQIRNNIQSLKAKSTHVVLSSEALRFPTPSVKLDWPLRPNNISNFTYYRITNYVDLDTAREVRDADDNYVSGRLDYNCGTRNYDGHNGLDISAMPYGWKMMNDEAISVIAAASGVIVGGDDGNTDNNCNLDNFPGPAWGNWIALMHDDSTVTTYIHLKSGSVIPRTIGQRVGAGAYVGYMASSGRSTGPHLHFGVYINNYFFNNGGWNEGSLREPFNGSCNNILPSFWNSQKSYNEPSVVAIETHNASPGNYTSNCDQTVSLYFDKSFNAGNTIYTRTWFRDWIDGSTAVIQLLNTAGAQMAAAVFTNTSGSRTFSYNWNISLSSTVPSGTYTIRVTFGGKVWERHVTVGCIQNYTVSGTLNSPKGYIAGNSITTTQIIESGADNRVEYHADNEILFTAGFHAKAGSHIIADGKGCTSGYH
jgi:murein DD-endopeptidase MepM/ murein hydrolase activator NlpD